MFRLQWSIMLLWDEKNSLMDPLQLSYARSCKISSLCEQQIERKEKAKKRAMQQTMNTNEGFRDDRK